MKISVINAIVKISDIKAIVKISVIEAILKISVIKPIVKISVKKAIVKISVIEAIVKISVIKPIVEISVKKDIVKISVIKAMIKNEMNEMGRNRFIPQSEDSPGNLSPPRTPREAAASRTSPRVGVRWAGSSPGCGGGVRARAAAPRGNWNLYFPNQRYSVGVLEDPERLDTSRGPASVSRCAGGPSRRPVGWKLSAFGCKLSAFG